MVPSTSLQASEYTFLRSSPSRSTVFLICRASFLSAHRTRTFGLFTVVSLVRSPCHGPIFLSTHFLKMRQRHLAYASLRADCADSEPCRRGLKPRQVKVFEEELRNLRLAILAS